MDEATQPTVERFQELLQNIHVATDAEEIVLGYLSKQCCEVIRDHTDVSDLCAGLVENHDSDSRELDRQLADLFQDFLTVSLTPAQIRDLKSGISSASSSAEALAGAVSTERRLDSTANACSPETASAPVPAPVEALPACLASTSLSEPSTDDINVPICGIETKSQLSVAAASFQPTASASTTSFRPSINAKPFQLSVKSATFQPNGSRGPAGIVAPCPEDAYDGEGQDGAWHGNYSSNYDDRQVAYAYGAYGAYEEGVQGDYTACGAEGEVGPDGYMLYGPYEDSGEYAGAEHGAPYVYGVGGGEDGVFYGYGGYGDGGGEYDDDGGEGEADALDMEEEEAMMAYEMSVLAAECPDYDIADLYALYLRQGSNLMLTLDTIFEAEHAPGCMRSRAAAPAQAPPVMDEENFPSLPSASSDGRRVAQRPQAPAPASPQWSEDSTALELPSVSLSLRYKSARAEQERNAPLPIHEKIKQEIAMRQQRGRRAPVGDAASQAVRWVETGSAVDAQYRRAREVARDHARMRNAFYQQATHAFLAGNKAQARLLSQKGREQARLMKEAHENASSEIFRQRNATSSGPSGAPPMVDLHGLHAKEAVAFLEARLHHWRTAPRGSAAGPAVVHVVVGTGHHTVGAHARTRVPEAVQQWLHAQGLSFCEPQPGLLEIRL